MEVASPPRLAIVGLGYGAGEQVTLRGYRTLVESRWTAYFGLPSPLAQFLVTTTPSAVDLDIMLDSWSNPDGFTARAVGVAVNAAVTFGRAAVAVTGHPAVANPFAAAAAATAAAANIAVEIVAAPSAFDAYLESWPADGFSSGTLHLDARVAAAMSHVVDARCTVVVWNAGYLSGADRLTLAAGLIRARGGESSVVLFRHDGAVGRWVFRLDTLFVWTPLIDTQTLVVVPGRVSVPAPC